MSYHVIHILTHGGVLYKERGRLYYRSDDRMRSAPIENIRALIIAARGISLSGQLISSLMEAGAVILHCGERYQPAGWTTPAQKTIHQDIIYHHLGDAGLRRKLWGEILAAKIRNQREVLTHLWIMPNPLDPHLQSLDEAQAAAVYFRHLFPATGQVGHTRNQRHRGRLNAMLNYGYAVVSSIVHRSLIAHGVMTNIGVNHRARYNASPMVYDVMEPLRPIVDGMAAGWLASRKKIIDTETEEEIMRSWARHIGSALTSYRVACAEHHLKLIDAVDIYVRDVAKFLRTRGAEGRLFIPHLDPRSLAAHHERSGGKK